MTHSFLPNFSRLVSGGGERIGDEGRVRKCGGDEAKVRGGVLLVRMVFCCVLSVGRPWGIGYTSLKVVKRDGSCPKVLARGCI